MLIETVVGERRAASGVQQDGRGGPFGDLIVNDIGLGRYFETARSKRMFVLTATGFTLVAANAGGIAAALQPIVGFYNPIGNTKAAVLQRVRTQTRSGTPGGPLYLALAGTAAAISTAAAGTITDTSLQGGASAMKAYNNVALTGFVASQMGSIQVPIGGPAAVAAGAGVYSFDVELAGSYIVPPGAVCAVTCSAVGTTHIVDADLVWAEVDWPL